MESTKLPEILWPKLRASIMNHHSDIICSRFDFSVTDGIKCLEYKADSASCLLECGLIQGEWAEAAGIS
jgi:glutathionylspermidine amidase/synthetase